MNRRTALQTAGALFGAMATAPAVATTKEPKPAPKALSDAGAAELDRWEEENYGKRGSVKRHRLNEALAALLPAFWEVAAAMNAVLDADYEVSDDSCWTYDVCAIRYFAESFGCTLQSEAGGEVIEAARAELARRVEAHERGVFHHCPVFWAWDAVARAKEAAWAVRDRDYGPGEEPTAISYDVYYQAWAVETWEGAFDNECHQHMNKAAWAAWMDRLLVRIDAA